jgi:SAM-dependent methyltransferase
VTVSRVESPWARLRPRRLVPAVERRVRRTWYRDGGPDDQWCRIVMNREIHAHLESLPPDRTSVLEVSGTSHREHAWLAYESSRYPDLDLCAPPAVVPHYDAVICEQVLEHVSDPWLAARTLHALCRPGGRLIVSTPFLIRVHPTPYDFWRFTEDGLRRLLEDAGFVVDATRSWGNKAAARGNLRRFPPMRPWRSLRNDAEFPLVVWAYAHRPDDDASH